MTDLINEIEKAIEKFTDKAVDRSDMDDEGYIRDRFEAQAIAFKSGCAFILPLLKKALENHTAKQVYLRECKMYGVFPSDKKIAEIEKQIADEMLKLLGGNHG